MNYMVVLLFIIFSYILLDVVYRTIFHSFSSSTLDKKFSFYHTWNHVVFLVTALSGGYRIYKSVGT